MASRRKITDTSAWCNLGQHMVDHAGFSKGQRTCRECRKLHYARNNYSLGKTCEDCGVPVTNRSLGCCLSCRSRRNRGTTETCSRTITAHGYALLGQHWEHPNANHRGQILEHVKVMSEKLGRALVKGENVHHINGVRDDNRPENLELWVTSQPSGQRASDLISWAWEILERYDGEEVA